jgi:hypothetical protein
VLGKPDKVENLFLTEDDDYEDDVPHFVGLIWVLMYLQVIYIQIFVLYSRLRKYFFKVIPVTGRGGPKGCKRLRFPYLYSRITDGGMAVSLARRPPTPPPPTGRFLVLISVRG